MAEVTVDSAMADASAAEPVVDRIVPAQRTIRWTGPMACLDVAPHNDKVRPVHENFKSHYWKRAISGAYVARPSNRTGSTKGPRKVYVIDHTKPFDLVKFT